MPPSSKGAQPSGALDGWRLMPRSTGRRGGGRCRSGRQPRPRQPGGERAGQRRDGAIHRHTADSAPARRRAGLAVELLEAGTHHEHRARDGLELLVRDREHLRLMAWVMGHQDERGSRPRSMSNWTRRSPSTGRSMATRCSVPMTISRSAMASTAGSSSGDLEALILGEPEREFVLVHGSASYGSETAEAYGAQPSAGRGEHASDRATWGISAQDEPPLQRRDSPAAIIRPALGDRAPVMHRRCGHMSAPAPCCHSVVMRPAVPWTICGGGSGSISSNRDGVRSRASSLDRSLLRSLAPATGRTRYAQNVPGPRPHWAVSVSLRSGRGARPHPAPPPVIEPSLAGADFPWAPAD